MKLTTFIEQLFKTDNDWRLKLTYGKRRKNIVVLDPKWNKIKSILRNLDGRNFSHVILEHKQGDYIQCAGKVDELTIEYREYTEARYKHFRLGYGGNRSPIGIKWVNLETAVGKIVIHKEEVLNVEDALRVFKSFFQMDLIPMDLTKRNITKMFATNKKL